jgi:hypothetical protein
MRNFRKKTARLQSRFYIRILQILGLCGAGFLCSCTKYGSPVAEYGVPYPDNQIRFYGNIQSEDSLKNLPGITVRIVNSGAGDSLETTTNVQGQYALYYYSYEGEILKLKVLDTDSAANLGYFKNEVFDIEINSRDVNNSEHQMDVFLEKK